jgi:hypothetical protein
LWLVVAVADRNLAALLAVAVLVVLFLFLHQFLLELLIQSRLARAGHQTL